MRSKIGKALERVDKEKNSNTELGQAMRTTEQKKIRAIRRLAQVERKKKLREKAKKEVISSLNTYIELEPDIQRVHTSLIKLLAEFERLVEELDEPLYIVQMENSGDMLIVRESNLKRNKYGKST